MAWGNVPATISPIALREPPWRIDWKSPWARTERLHPFADRADVEQTLTRMAAAEPPLVRVLPRGPREHDARWVHLLGPVEVGARPRPSPRSTATRCWPAAPRRGTRRSAPPTRRWPATTPTTSPVSFAHLPFERWLLERVAAGPGPVVEVGCGPGHVTAYLASRGADATGIDLTPEMVDEARRRYPEGSYEVGDLRRLMRPPGADGWGAVLGWYSLIHLAGSELPAALDALVRPLAPGGTLALALHAGDEVYHHTEWFEHVIDLDFVFHEPAEMVGLFERAGLTDVEWYRRGPSRARNEWTERLYLLARKP